MSTQAVTIITRTPAGLDLLGAAANHSAAKNVLSDYQARKSQETKRRQAADIKLFETYLAAAGHAVSDMAANLDAWSGVTWGLVDGFNRWSLGQGYAIGSVNVRLATIKAYAKLAVKHGTLDAATYSLVKAVQGYRQTEGRNLDETRDQTRRPEGKKAEPVLFSLDQARKLKQQQPGTKKGRRDALLMCLLLDLGLRCGEIAGLDVKNINLDAGTLTFYRHKVDKWQTLNLERDVMLAARAYLEQSSDQDAPLFSGPCSGKRMSERTINARIATLGAKIGIVSLSPHDCRHYWATNAIRTGTDTKSLQDAGGWSSPAMPLRYAASSKIANQGVKLTV